MKQTDEKVCWWNVAFLFLIEKEADKKLLRRGVTTPCSSPPEEGHPYDHATKVQELYWQNHHFLCSITPKEIRLSKISIIKSFTTLCK